MQTQTCQSYTTRRITRRYVYWGVHHGIPERIPRKILRIQGDPERNHGDPPCGSTVLRGGMIGSQGEDREENLFIRSEARFRAEHRLGELRGSSMRALE